MKMMKQIRNEDSCDVLDAMSVEEFTYLFDKMQTVDGVHIIPNIIAKYDVMSEILNTLIKEYDYELYSVSFAPKEVDGYEAEFLLTADENYDIWIEPMLFNDKYLNPVDASFVHGDCNSKIITSYPNVLFIPFELSPNS